MHISGNGALQVIQPTLSGQKAIRKYVGRSWSTIRIWIDDKEFPARKLDGIWEAKVELIIQWRQRQIPEWAGQLKARDSCHLLNRAHRKQEPPKGLRGPGSKTWG